MVHAHFDHRCAMLLAQSQQGKRQADVVVEIAAGRQHMALPDMGRHDGGAHVLHRGFAVAAGDGNQWNRKTRAPCGGETTKAQPSVIHHQQWQLAIRMGICPDGVHHRCRSTLRDSFGGKLMAVEAIAAQCDEKTVLRNGARIRKDRSQHHVAIDGARIYQLCCFGKTHHG